MHYQEEPLQPQQQQELNYIPDDENDDFDCLLELEPLPLDAPEITTFELASLSAFMFDYSSASSPTTSSSTTSRPRPRRVCFAPDENTNVISVPSFACFPEEERRCLWYRQAEIESFRTGVRHACRKLRTNPFACEGSESTTRGLEFRTSLDRQLNKHLTLRCILKAQSNYPPHHLDSASQLAELALRCTESPRRAAEKQGSMDYCSVYHHPAGGGSSDSCCFSSWTSPLSPAKPLPTTTTKRQPFSCSDDSMRLSKRHCVATTTSSSFGQEASFSSIPVEGI